MKIIKNAFIILLVSCTILQSQSDDGISFVYAKKLLADSLYDLAAEQFHLFAQENPQHPQAAQSLLLSGKCYYHSQQYKLAIKEFSLLITRFPEGSILDQAHFELAKAFSASGEIKAAAKSFHQVYLFYPKSNLGKVSLLKAAQKFYELKNFDQVKRIVYDLRESFPNSNESFEGRLILVDVLIETKVFNRAENEINKLLSLTAEGIINAKALFRKGKLEYITGRSYEAELTFKQLLDKYSARINEQPFSELIRDAYYEYATLLKEKGFFDLSNEQLYKIPSNLLQNRELFLLAKNLIEQKYYQKATSYLENPAQNRADSFAYVESNYLRGYCFSNLEDFYQANQSLEKAFSLATKNDSARKFIPLIVKQLMKNYEKNEQFSAEIQLLMKYSKICKRKEEIARAIFKIGKIYQEKLQEFDRAIRIFENILNDLPKSELIDDAQFQIAKCYAQKNDISQAKKEFQRVIRNHPASLYVKDSQLAIKFYETHVPSTENLLNLIPQLFSEFSEDRHSKRMRLAEFYFNEVKNYQLAISQCQKMLQEDVLSSTEKRKIYNLVGQSYFFLAQKDFDEFDSSYLDSAARYFDLIVTENQSDEWADKAAWKKIEVFKITKLKSNSAFENEYLQLLRDFIFQYPESPHTITANLELAQFLVKKGVFSSIDSLDIANALFYAENHAQDELQKLKIKLLRAKFFKQISDDNSALSSLKSLANDPKNIYLCETIKTLMNFGDMNRDIGKILANFIEKHYYSSCCDEVKLGMAKIYLNEKKNQEAKSLLTYLYQKFTEKSILDVPGNKETLEKVVFLLGKCNQKLNSRGEAIKSYQTYLEKFPDGVYKEEVLFQLGHLFSSNNPDEMKKAIDYFKQIEDGDPQSSYADSATLKIGDLFFELKNYEKAKENYLKILSKDSTTVEKSSAEAKFIRCQINMGNIDKKLTIIKQFKKKYDKKHPMVPDLMLDAANYYIKQKDFDIAEDILKDVKSDYKKMEQAARAEYLLGKMYFILNKDEDALKILTKMIEKYPQYDRIIADAYMTLGNFYYLQAKQVQNALFAYQKASKLKGITSDQKRMAMNNEIRCYTDLRMREQAISAIYKYLDEFPDAEDVFEKKVLMGILFYELHEYDRALAILKKLKFEADVENEPRIQYWIGECYVGKGDFKRAVSEYLKVAYLSKPTKLNWGVTAKFQAGVAYMKAGEPEKAKEIFATIVREQGVNSVFGKPAKAKMDEIDKLLSQKRNK